MASGRRAQQPEVSLLRGGEDGVERPNPVEAGGDHDMSVDRRRGQVGALRRQVADHARVAAGGVVFLDEVVHGRAGTAEHERALAQQQRAAPCVGAANAPASLVVPRAGSSRYTLSTVAPAASMPPSRNT